MLSGTSPEKVIVSYALIFDSSHQLLAHLLWCYLLTSPHSSVILAHRLQSLQNREGNRYLFVLFQGEFFSAFKQASRREDDIAKVTCGMRVLFEPGTTHVKELALCFGGMADRTISALKTTRKQLSQ